MTILAIETSCDETAIALVSKNKGFKILSNIVASQVKIHEKFGGVYPSLAKREHQKNLVPVLIEALEEAKLLKKSKIQMTNAKFHPPKFCKAKIVASKMSKPKCQKLEKILQREKDLWRSLKVFLKKYQKPKIDAIAVTIGPGLEPCLWVGVNFAKALACFWELPIIPVNHLEAHIIANFVGKSQISNLKSQIFPAICLIISGGHTQLVLMKDFGDYKILGETRDDAAGECFDKTARILGLGYPGGPAIAAEAAELQTTNYKLQTKLPRPMINQKNYDFSFSGLKTAVLYDFKKRNPEARRSKKYIREMATEIQQAIIDVLIKKTIRAAKDYRAKTIILAGGVAANNELRRQLNYKLQTISYKLNFLAPPKNLCTDNAAMIGVTAFYHLDEKKNWQEVKAQANLRL